MASLWFRSCSRFWFDFFGLGSVFSSWFWQPRSLTRSSKIKSRSCSPKAFWRLLLIWCEPRCRTSRVGCRVWWRWRPASSPKESAPPFRWSTHFSSWKSKAGFAARAGIRSGNRKTFLVLGAGSPPRDSCFSKTNWISSSRWNIQEYFLLAQSGLWSSWTQSFFSILRSVCSFRSPRNQKRTGLAQLRKQPLPFLRLASSPQPFSFLRLFQNLKNQPMRWTKILHHWCRKAKMSCLILRIVQ